MAEQNVYQIVQEFCRRRGLPQPPAAVGAFDDTTQQIVGLLNEQAQDLADRYFFQALTQIVNFTHAKAPGYVAVDFNTQFTDFKALVQDSLWDTTNRLPVAGPLSSDEWGYCTTMSISPTTYSFRLYGNALRIYPAPSGTSPVFRMEYISRGLVWDPTAGLPLETYTSDACYPRIPAPIILADLRWRWAEIKGLPYAESQRLAEEMILNYVGREPNRTLSMDGFSDQTVGPGLLVAAGSWPL